MGYELAAIIGFESVINSLDGKYSALRVVPLNIGLAMVPLTTELANEIETDENQVDTAFPGAANGAAARKLFPRVISFLREISDWGPVIYCEAEFSKGAGTQYAAVWQARKVILGPTYTTWGHFGNPANKVRMTDLAINHSLRRLGVQPRDNNDEFDTIGLGWKKRTEAWY